MGKEVNLIPPRPVQKPPKGVTFKSSTLIFSAPNDGPTGGVKVT